ncbi:MAG: hypothetical protein H6711_23145 [Myxococcales bacterium]|nr:hypothetical protein [Myxococcales bacterium]
MPTVADLQRASPRTLRIFLERDGLRAGPFLEILDPDRALVLPGRERGGAEEAAKGPVRLTLRRGRVADPFVRGWLNNSHTFSGAPEYLELAIEDSRGVELARWRLDDARILEVANRRRRAPDDERYEYLLFEGTPALSVGAKRR